MKSKTLKVPTGNSPCKKSKIGGLGESCTTAIEISNSDRGSSDLSSERESSVNESGMEEIMK